MAELRTHSLSGMHRQNISNSQGQDMKRKIRNRVSQRRRKMTAAEKAWMDKEILEQLLEMPDLEKAGIVYCYVSFGNEVDTLQLIRTLWERQTQVAVPRVEGKQIFFYRIKSMEELSPGCNGILEPAERCIRADCRFAPVITPGMAFSPHGSRIGYGGGFYDRFFGREPEHLRIAVAYPFQIFEKLPTDPYDQKVEMIVTGKKIYCCQ